MPMLVCMKCSQFFHPKRNGVTVEEGMPIGDSSRGEGTWAPYKLWRADLWECLGCGTEVVAGFGAHHFAEHYQPDYASQRVRSAPIVFVKDCI